MAVVNDFGLKMSERGRSVIPPGVPIDKCVGIICEDLWEAFSSAEYIAATEISLGLRSDKRAFSALQKVMKAAEQELDAHWVDIFSGYGYEPAFLVTLRHLVQATLRGLAIRRLYRPEPTDWEQERHMLETMIVAFLAKNSDGSRFKA